MLRATEGRWYTRDPDDPIDFVPDPSPGVRVSADGFQRRDLIDPVPFAITALGAPLAVTVTPADGVVTAE